MKCARKFRKVKCLNKNNISKEKVLFLETKIKNLHLIVSARVRFLYCHMQHQFNGSQRYDMAAIKSGALLKSVFLSGASRVVHVREITGSRFLTVQNKLVYGVFAPKTPLKHIPKRTFGPTRRKSNIGWAREANWVLSREGVGGCEGQYLAYISRHNWLRTSQPTGL